MRSVPSPVTVTFVLQSGVSANALANRSRVVLICRASGSVATAIRTTASAERRGNKGGCEAIILVELELPLDTVRTHSALCRSREGLCALASALQ